MPAKILNVTQEDIDSGVRNSAASCAISLAAQRRFGTRCAVGYRSLTVYGDSLEIWNLPQKATDFIQAFDCDQGCNPAKFRITRRFLLPTTKP